MVKPLFAYFVWMAINPGISARQGGHQVAQKSKMTTLPLKSESLTGFPSTSLNCQSGAAVFEAASRVGSPQKNKAAPASNSNVIFKYFGPRLNIILISVFVLFELISIIT